MRILLLTTEAYGGHGGIAQYNRDLIEAICNHPDCDEVVAFPRFVKNKPEEMPLNLTYVTEGTGSKIKFILTVIKHLIGDRNFDLFICCHINLSFLSILTNYILKAPILLFVYGIDVWQPTKSFINNLAIQKIDAIVSISQITIDKFLQWGNIDHKKMYILPNAIDLNEYGPSSKNKKLLDLYNLHDKRVLLTLGRISSDERYKGFDEIIEIIPELLKEIDNLVYMIAGDGSDRKRLEKKVKDLNIENHVIFTGYIKESEKKDYYRLADTFAMPGSGEGFGFVFLEAMACGIPVVASKVDGSREAVRNGLLGIMVDPYDSNDVKSGILNALKKSRKVPCGLDFFSFNNFQERLYRIINSIIIK